MKKVLARSTTVDKDESIIQCIRASCDVDEEKFNKNETGTGYSDKASFLRLRNVQTNVQTARVLRPHRQHGGAMDPTGTSTFART